MGFLILFMIRLMEYLKQERIDFSIMSFKFQLYVTCSTISTVLLRFSFLAVAIKHNV